MVSEDEDHDHAGNQLHEDILERIGHRHGDQQHREHLYRESQG